MSQKDAFAAFMLDKLAAATKQLWEEMLADSAPPYCCQHQ